MSNFPIIPTTPPPLEFNDNEEEEEEPDFGPFNDVLAVDEKDLEFVVPESNQHIVHDLEVKPIDYKTSTLECDSEDRQRCEDSNSFERLDVKYDDKSDDKSIKSIDFSERDIDFVTTDDETQRNSSEAKDLEFDSQQNDLKSSDSNDSSINDLSISNDLEDNEDKDEVVNEEVIGFECIDSEDNDFADFTSFKDNVCEESDNKNEFFEDNKTFSDFEPQFETTFGNFTTNLNQNFDAINGLESNENDLNDSKSDDDFADFASAQPVVSNQFEAIPKLKTNASDIPEMDANDGEFADFASFNDNFNGNEFTEYSGFHTNVSSNEGKDKLTEIFAQLFPICADIDSTECDSIHISRNLFINCEENSEKLWKALQDLETAPSLKLRWSQSHSFQQLLAALNIDPRNILRNPSVPVFASGLGCVLEPSKPKLNSDPNDDNFNEYESQPSNDISGAAIPPVQFDWSSSGLTNPLDMNQKSMVAFDLDFFVTNDDVKSTSKPSVISSFEDLLNDNQNQTNIENNSQVLDTNKSNLMKQLLSSVGTVGTTSSATNVKSDTTHQLSAEALQVLQELPNISFMRAKVLMFPLKG